MPAGSLPSYELSVRDYAASVASAAPTPGGGSVAGVTGSFAAALAEMVCRLTLAGKHPPVDPSRLQGAADRATELRQTLLNLASDDEAAYGAYRAASGLPKSTDDEKLARRGALDAAIIVAADVPLATAEACLQVLDTLRAAAQDGTKHALSDVATGAMLANAAAKSALLNVSVNAGSMREQEVAAGYLGRADALIASFDVATAAVMDIVSSRS